MSTSSNAIAAFKAVQSVIQAIHQITEYEHERLTVVLKPMDKEARRINQLHRQQQQRELVDTTDKARETLVPEFMAFEEGFETFGTLVRQAGELQGWEAAFTRRWQSQEAESWIDPEAVWVGPETGLAKMEPLIEAKLQEAYRESARRRVAQWEAAKVFDERTEPLQACLERLMEVAFFLGGKARRERTDARSIDVATPAPTDSATGVEREDRLRFDGASLSVTLDGKHYQVNDPNGFEVYRVLAEAHQIMSKTAIAREVRGVKGPKTIPALIKRLPAMLRKTIRRDNRGYWLALARKKNR